MDFQRSYLCSLAARLAGASEAASMHQTSSSSEQGAFAAAVTSMLALIMALDGTEAGGRVEALERGLSACRAPIEAGALGGIDRGARDEIETLLGSIARTVGRMSRRPRAVAPPASETAGRRQRHGQRRYKPAI